MLNIVAINPDCTRPPRISTFPQPPFDFLESFSSTMDDSSDLSSPLSSVPSSPLSSLASLSPSPPPEMAKLRAGPYPSPPASQQTSHSGSPVPDGMVSGASSDKDGPPPAKRRRISKERTTEYLDLQADTIDPDQQEQLDRLLKVLHKHQKIVVVAGAGISVSAGSKYKSGNLTK